MTAVPSAVAHLGEDFLAQVYGRSYRYFPGRAGRFTGLLTWDDLNDILTHHRLEPPRLRLAKNGAALPQHEYAVPVTTRRNVVWHRLQPAALHQQLADGATLVLDAVDELHPRVAAFTDELERYFRTRIQVNGYASFTGTEGFGIHWDDHDVLVVQLSGAKRWRIYGTTRAAPLHRDVEAPEPPPDEPVAELVMTSGDMLYLPRGWWHAVTASEGVSSLHLTCGLQTTTGADLIAWLADILRQEHVVRADIPRFGSAEGKRAFSDALHKVLSAELSSEDLIDRFTAARDETDIGRPRPSLPHLDHVPPERDVLVRLITARATVTDDPEGHAVLRAGGQEWAFTAKVRPLLDRLTDGAEHPLGELAETAQLTTGEAASVVGQLIDGDIATLGGAR